MPGRSPRVPARGAVRIEWDEYARLSTVLRGWWLSFALRMGFALSFLLVPFSVSKAVLRSRLFDVDVLINRTLVYGALTATLVLVYFAGVTATQAHFQTLTGQQKLPQLAIMTSTLLIAALFTPLAPVDSGVYRQAFLQTKV